MSDSIRPSKLSFLVDITSDMNELNLQLQEYHVDTVSIPAVAPGQHIPTRVIASADPHPITI